MTGTEYSSLRRDSDETAHRGLFDEYYAYVYTVVWGRLCGFSREDAEECVSDVFAELFCTLDCGHAHNGELSGLVATVAKRRAIDRYRSLAARKRRAPVSLDDADFDEVRADGSIEEDVERAEQRRQLIACVEALGEPDSTIIVQKYYFGRSSREIARMLAMKPSAVRMRCSRALAHLKAALSGVM